MDPLCSEHEKAQNGGLYPAVFWETLPYRRAPSQPHRDLEMRQEDYQDHNKDSWGQTGIRVGQKPKAWDPWHIGEVGVVVLLLPRIRMGLTPEGTLGPNPSIHSGSQMPQSSTDPVFVELFLSSQELQTPGCSSPTPAQSQSHWCHTRCKAPTLPSWLSTLSHLSSPSADTVDLRKTVFCSGSFRTQQHPTKCCSLF